jgi:HAD superfamily hydrolase (TIGR01549 family)
MKWQAVFWDFDGVVVDSVDVKTRAFAKMFSQYGPHVEQAVVDYHLANGGISRFQKFRHYYNNILNRSISEEELARLSVEFSSLVYQEVLTAPFVKGALETLEKLKKNKIPCFIVSGTPQEEIVLIVNKRVLSEYFCEVHGSPRVKTEIVHDIIKRFNYSPPNCLFLGDAITDYEAAKENGVHFIGIVPIGGDNNFPDGTVTNTFVGIELK